MTTKTKIMHLIQVSPDSKNKDTNNDNCNIDDQSPTSLPPNSKYKKQQIDYRISFQLRSENYVQFDDAKPGDVIMATAFKIKHPTYVKDKIIRKNYLVFRVINHFCYLEVDRLNITEKLEVQWMAVGGRQDWNVSPMQKDDVKIILKANETELKHMNDFVADVIRNNFFFFKSDVWLAYIRKEGWCLSHCR